PPVLVRLVGVNSREAAQEYSPRRKPWVTGKPENSPAERGISSRIVLDREWRLRSLLISINKSASFSSLGLTARKCLSTCAPCSPASSLLASFSLPATSSPQSRPTNYSKTANHAS